VHIHFDGSVSTYTKVFEVDFAPCLTRSLQVRSHWSLYASIRYPVKITETMSDRSVVNHVRARSLRAIYAFYRHPLLSYQQVSQEPESKLRPLEFSPEPTRGGISSSKCLEYSSTDPQLLRRHILTVVRRNPRTLKLK
jgi:hypothetical protein